MKINLKPVSVQTVVILGLKSLVEEIEANGGGAFL